MEEKCYCYKCDVDVIPKCVTETNNYTFRGKEFKVKEVILRCRKCNSELFTDDIVDKSMHEIYNMYLKLFDLSFEKLVSIRKNLNLSQELMSRILGWSKKSIVRYENFESVPQGEYLNMYIELNNNPYLIVKILERQKSLFKDEEYYKILRKLPFFDNYKSINVISFLLKDNPLYETSLMKNCFIIDFYSYKKYGKSITNFKYARLPYGPCIDNRNKLYNMMIKNNYMEIEITDGGTIFDSSFDYDNNLFDSDELEILKSVKEKLKKYSAKELSEWSHNFMGWKNTKNGDIISYSYADELDTKIVE